MIFTADGERWYWRTVGSRIIKKWSKVEILAKSGPMRKVDGSWFFRPDFIENDQKVTLYGFMEKQPPQKALCLGPDPPLGFSINFIDFIGFLRF
jgi:hypothetical protein